MNNRVACVDRIHANFIRKIKQPLLDKGHCVDVILTSYDDEESKQLTRRFSDVYKPLETLTVNLYVQYGEYSSKSTQADNFMSIMNLLQSYYEQYDRILFLRYELCYKTNINNWDIFESKGIFFPYKEEGMYVYQTHHYVSDCVLLLDRGYFQRFLAIVRHFYGMYKAKTPIPPQNTHPFFNNNLHDLQTMIDLYDPEFPVHFMFDGYFQSNTDCSDSRASPMFVLLHRPYPLNDLYKLDNDE